MIFTDIMLSERLYIGLFLLYQVKSQENESVESEFGMVVNFMGG